MATKKLYKKVKFKTRKEWLAGRRIGGSSASALFGSNPYMTILDVYCAAVNPNINEDEDEVKTSSQEYGISAENLIREIVKLNFADKFNVISPKGFEMYVRKDKPYLTATLDGILQAIIGDEKWILEIKTHDVLNKEDLLNWENQLPQNYFIQNLHYQVVLNDFAGSICVAKLRFFKFEEDGTRVLDKEEIRYYRMPRKDFQRDIVLLEKVETDFYEQHIAKHIPPNIKIKL